MIDQRATETPAQPVRRRNLRQTLRDLDPRVVVRAGPTLPFVALALAGFVTQFDDQALGVLMPDIRTDFGVDLQFIITMQVYIGLFLQQLGAPLFGFLADRLSRVWMMRTGSVLGYASTIASGFAGTVPALVGARIGFSAGNAIVAPAGFPLLADLYPTNVRGRLFGFLAVVGNVGAFAAPMLAGTLGALFGWRVAVIALGTAALGVSALLFFVREPARGYIERKELGLGDEAARREQRPVGWAEAWRAARAVVTIRRLWYAAPFLGVSSFVALGLMGYYYRDEFGASTQLLGVIASLNFGVAFVVLAFAGGTADRILGDNPGRVMSIMGGIFVFQAAAFVGLWASPNLVVSVAINVVVASLNALFLPAYAAMLSLVVPPRIRGLGLTSHLPFMSIGAFVIAPIAGAIADSSGFRPAMLLVVPAALIAAAILGTSGHGVARDIRSARAAALAQDEARAAGGTLLLCRGVEVEHAAVQIVFGVDLDVEQGEILALLGTNGAGKSTLLRAIAGVHPASAGGVIFDGDEITHLPPHEVAARGVVLLPGGRAVFPSLTVAENLRAAGWLARDGEAAARTEHVLDTFGILRERMDLPAGDLSGGEQQMLAIGQALIMRPRLLMIDELSLGLAPAVVTRLLEIVRELHEAGTTIILVEQSVNLALTIAERAVFMEKGRVTFDGPTAELLRRGDIVRSVFLGTAVTGKELTTAQGVRRRRRRTERATVLDVSGVTVRYGGVAAVDDVSLELAEREIVGIIGPNGAGKSTLMDAISGFAPIDSGRIVVADRDVTALAPPERARAGLGRSFQHAMLFPTMTVRDAIAVSMEAGLAEHGTLAAAAWLPQVRAAERSVRRRIDHLIELLGLEHAADAFVSELSTAMRRIVDLACVTAMAPRALLLDEPSSGLAQAETEELGPLLRRLVAETGCGLLIIEHDVPLVSTLSDRLIAMELGRVIAEGEPARVIADEAVIRAALGARQDVIARSGRAPTTE